MTRYIVGVHGDDEIVILGVQDGPDIGTATMAAQVRWPQAGCFPWDAATKAQREQALLAMNGDLRLMPL